MKVTSGLRPVSAAITVENLPMLAKGKKTGKVVLLQRNDSDDEIKSVTLERGQGTAEVGRIRIVKEHKLNTSFVPYDGTITLEN